MTTYWQERSGKGLSEFERATGVTVDSSGQFRTIIPRGSSRARSSSRRVQQLREAQRQAQIKEAQRQAEAKRIAEQRARQEASKQAQQKRLEIASASIQRQRQRAQFGTRTDLIKPRPKVDIRIKPYIEKKVIREEKGIPITETFFVDPTGLGREKKKRVFPTKKSYTTEGQTIEEFNILNYEQVVLTSGEKTPILSPSQIKLRKVIPDVERKYNIDLDIKRTIEKRTSGVVTPPKVEKTISYLGGKGVEVITLGGGS